MKLVYRKTLLAFILALAAPATYAKPPAKPPVELATSMLRVVCEGDDVGAEVSINGKFRGECPIDVQVAPGTLKLRVEKKDPSYERVFEQEIRMGDGVVKKVEAILSKRLNEAAQQREDKRMESELRQKVQAGEPHQVVQAYLDKDQLSSTGKVTRGRIGVTIQELTRELAEQFGLSKLVGALISSVEKNGPADKAGIEASDVILKFDGKPVDNSSYLPRMVAATRPGSKVTVELWRKGGTQQVTVEIGEMPQVDKAEAGLEKAVATVKVTIFRKNQFVGGAMLSKISIGDRWVGSLSNGESIAIDVPVGSYTLSVLNSSSWGGHECHSKVILSAGTAYRYFLDFFSGSDAGCTLTLQD